LIFYKPKSEILTKKTNISSPKSYCQALSVRGLTRSLLVTRFLLIIFLCTSVELKAQPLPIEPLRQSTAPFNEPLDIAEDAAGNSVLVNRQGKVLKRNLVYADWLDQPAVSRPTWGEGLWALRDLSTGKVGFVDPKGQWVIAPKFVDAYEFQEGLAAVKLHQNGLIGFVNRKGHLVIPAKFGSKFRNPPRFHEGLAAVGLDNDWPRTNLDKPGRMGYIDHSGRWVVKPIYSNGDHFLNGRANVLLNGQNIEIKHPLKER
jgi:hypothetical protein